MKNIKINKELRTRIILGGLSLVLVASGFGLGNSGSKNNNESEDINASIVSIDGLVSYESINQLGDFDEKYDTLEKESPSLTEQKKRTQSDKTFNIENLIVLENTNENNQSDLYILHVTNDDGTCYEYYERNINESNQSNSHILDVPNGDGTCYEHCNEFKTWFGLYLDIDENMYDLWPGYIYCNNCQPLFSYLTDTEIESLLSNSGKITRLDLEKISARIRNEHKQQLSENNYSKF